MYVQSFRMIPLLIYILPFVCISPKVNAPDVGGTEMLSKIKSDILEIVGDAVTLNMICYCLHVLEGINSKSILSSYSCCLCFNSLRYEIFLCRNESCIYHSIRGELFHICPSCYEKGERITLSRTEDEQKRLFVSKLRSSIRAISYISVLCAIRTNDRLRKLHFIELCR